MKIRKRGIRTALCLALSALLLFLIWVNNGYGTYSYLPMSMRLDRLQRQLMLEKLETVHRGEDGSYVCDGGEYMLVTDMGRSYSLCKLENDAAVLPGKRGIGFRGSAVTEIELPFYSLHRHSGAESAELEIYVSRTLSPYGSGEHRELHFTLPSENCTDGIATFTLRIESPDSHTVSLADDFRLCLDWGSIVNAVYYKINLRFYDTNGELISESVFEMGEKES
ncbi:MAG: hypothetical protein IJY96_04340 [Oscillospiraceae bacterium]|nr:hypothetical protein [Oscillospiraceae bacterium]